MGIWTDLLANFFIFIASLVYALFDLIIAEIIFLAIAKESLFKKSEYFVFLTLGFGTLIFFLSNLFQDSAINYLANLGWWSVLIFISILCINIFVLSKFTLERTWKFRLVVIPLVILGVIILALIIYMIFISNNPEQATNVVTNATELL